MEEFTKAQDGVSKLSPLTEPNKGQRPSQQPESIAEMCSKAGILYRTRIEPNKEQRPSQQPESLMERLKNFSAACTNNEGQRPNLVKQEVQPRNEQEKWKLMMEPFVKDKTKNPYFRLIQAEQIAKENRRRALTSKLDQASNDLEEKVKTEKQRLPASH